MLASLAMVVYYADHLAHSIQADAIGKRVEQATLVVVHGRWAASRNPPPVNVRIIWLTLVALSGATRGR
ncbi:MAG TPA: hypothetical protein VII33_06065 [Nakamurella sp.]